MKRKYQRDICMACNRPFTEEEKLFRLEERRQNVLNSRNKARANGKSLGRKKRGDTELIKRLREQGYSIRGIARLSGVSTTAVSTSLKDIGMTSEYMYGRNRSK